VTRPEPARERLNIVVVGHVDHGKSTVVGRLLADTGSLPQGRLERVRDHCARHSKPFEYAFLLDALRDEQSQGITIDAARIFFKTERRDYMIIDAPGHVEFLKNMVSGASNAGAALLVVDAAEGVRENSKRHGYLLALLGITQVAVLVNKMDAVGRGESAFRGVADECREFLRKVGIEAACFIPTAAALGENLALRTDGMPWYSGPTTLEALDAFRVPDSPVARPFRMPVQDVYKFAAPGDDRRIVVGTVESGSLQPGDRVVFYPSGKSSTVKTIEGFPSADAPRASAGQAAGFTLTEQVYVRRGELAALGGQPRPAVVRRLRASIFWLGREPLRRDREYVLKLGAARVRARLEEVSLVVDAATLAPEKDRSDVRRHEAADCLLLLDAPLACDPAADNPALGRFVLVDGREIAGGGLVREALAAPAAPARERVRVRNAKWRAGFVGLEKREERFGQRAGLVIVTGSDDARRRDVAKTLEARLFAEGRFAYFLGIGSVLYGLAADIREGSGDHAEDIRRVAEVAHILIDAGLILVVTASRLPPEDLELILESVDPARALTVWIGRGPTLGLACNAQYDDAPVEECTTDLLKLMRRRGLIKD
jgi:bifunctional enzyme CysN/CysC